jgi:hypothetical protein
LAAQLGAQSDVAGAIGTAHPEIARRKGACAVTVVTPPAVVQTPNDVAGNRAPMSRGPAGVIRTVGMRGARQAGLRDPKPGKRVATPRAGTSAEAA